MTENTKPTVAELVSAVKEYQNLDVVATDITEDIYNGAIRGWERGVSLRSMSNRVKFYLVSSKKQEENKETTSFRGVFLGSQDICNEKKPLGKNKSQSISFLSEGDDGFFRVFAEPNSPSHFKSFKKNDFGSLVDVDFSFTKTERGMTFVTPENVRPVEKNFEIDTGQIKVYDAKGLLDTDKYVACAVAGTISTVKSLRIPNWEQHNYPDMDDYPLTMNDSPVFQVYLTADTDAGEPIIKGYVNPTHIARPYIALDDFNAMWPVESELMGIDDTDEFLQDEITSMYSGVDVILIGQRKNHTEYEGKTYIDFYINGIIPVNNEPSIIEALSTADKIKKAKQDADNEGAKKQDKEAMEARKIEIRREKVAGIVASMKGFTTVEVVRNTCEAKVFSGVEDDYIQALIDEALAAQGIGSSDDIEDVWE